MALLIVPLFTAGIAVGGIQNASAGGPVTIVVDADGKVGHSNPRNIAQCDGTRIDVGMSIQAAINAADPGDTIIVCPGDYDESVVVNESDITVKGIAKPMVDGSGSPAFTITRDRVHLTGFDVTSDDDDCIYVNDVNDVRIHGNITSGCDGNGILADGTRNTISGNNFSGNDNNGIRCFDCFDSVIKGNIVNDNGVDGIKCDRCFRSVIQGNTAIDNAGDGIELSSDSDDNLVKGNTANDNGGFGFNDGGGSGNDYSQNRCRDNGTAGSNTGDLCKPQP